MRLLGWEYRYYEPVYGGSTPRTGWYCNGKFVQESLPSADLNNLFEYAVPKLQESYYVTLAWDWYEKLYRASIDSKDSVINPTQLSREDIDPAQALYKAIQEVINANTRED